MSSPSAEDLYEKYAMAHERNGVTVKDWNEIGGLERQAWEKVADYVYVVLSNATCEERTRRDK